MLVAAPCVVTSGMLPRIAGGMVCAQALQCALLWGCMAVEHLTLTIVLTCVKPRCGAATAGK